ncbi:hypothetical protein A2Y83_05125 [Candidatus Falkowbacteria bacterium RBG_13_39_14]|uniref:Response regulatory domain-containing protein n=1 Tax=Candidatus Falkowbacteria bacterium RBG_13_39_14 TaxID=1797985 RepID=A0A1F5S1X9_9BACT|nr:MAG: hypothetical protein A2Y83_05125 [Candidatus Falkowbacteria bacterium RBG_13_39_14]
MGGKNKILIIEDEEFLADVLETKIKKEGFEVLVARDGAAGYTQIKNWAPDLILLDILMPHMNGYEVLEKLYDKKIETPVIIISNSGQPVELEKIKKLGAVDYLVKTEFEPQEVVQKIKKYIENGQKKENESGGDNNNSGKVKVMLVEDEQLLREICGKKLIIGGYDVVEVIDGGDVLAKIKKEKPDLVLLDIILPTVNGFEILKQVRSHEDPIIAKTPVLILSNLGQESDVEKAMQLGADGYLVKAQFTTDEIVEKVKNILKM